MAKTIHNADFDLVGKLTISDIVNAQGEILTVDGLNQVNKRSISELLTDLNAATADHIHNFIHEQGIPSSEWTIFHDLNKMASITVVDSAGSVVQGAIQYIDNTKIVVTFNGAFSGKAYLN